MHNLAEIKTMVRAHNVRPVGDFLRFSVLLPLVETEEGICLLYEKRAENISQPGESSFPGGRVEKGETPEQAAIRETAEELQITMDRIRMIGRWNPLVTYHNMIIDTFIGEITDYRPERFVPNDEVAEIFHIPLSFFIENEPRRFHSKLKIEPPQDFPYSLLPNEKDYPFRVGTHETLFWVWKNRVIWGLTATITKDFIDHVKETI